ncbi:MAG: hypothetical protein AAFN50_03865, partial [Pseudomonadota bacterium]
VLLAIAMWVNASQERLYNELTANRAAMHQDYDSLLNQRRLVDAYHRRYQHFSDLGFVGRESRLDWVETLRSATESVALPRLSYSIEPQLEVVPPMTSVLGGDDIQIRVSKVQLEMGLVHEYDLLRFFDALQVEAPGFIKVDSCQLVFEGERRDAGGKAKHPTCAAQIYSVITSDVSREAV